MDVTECLVWKPFVGNELEMFHKHDNAHGKDIVVVALERAIYRQQ